MIRRGLRALPLALLPVLVTAGPAEAGPVVSGTGPTVVHNSAYAGAATQVWAVSSASRTTVVMVVRGMPASAVGKTFGAHAHVGACATDPLASGGHYINPAAGGSVPLADKEIWLDFKVRTGGFAVAVAQIDWLVQAGHARSVVIHEMATNHQTGAAGARLMCTNVAFGS